MRAVLFEWRGTSFHPYPVMNFIGIVIGVMAGTFEAPSRSLDADVVNVVLLLLLLPALLGARLLFVATHWELYRHEPIRILRRADGGASLFGGLAFAFLFSLPLLGVLRVGIGAFWDVASITILIGLAFTKVGCFLNGCCAGRLSRGWLAIVSRNERGILGRRAPAQLLESAVAVVILLGAFAFWNQMPFDGAIFLAALGSYCVARFSLERARESSDTVGKVNTNRVIAAALVTISTASFMIFWLQS